MTAMQVERGGQRVWINLSDRVWTPQEVPKLLEHMARAQRREAGYNQNNQNEFAVQFTQVLRGFDGEAVGEVVREILALDGWWRLPHRYWALSQLQARDRVVAAMRAQWEAVSANSEEARVIGRWLWQMKEITPDDAHRIRAMRGAGTNPEAVQLSLDLLAYAGALGEEDLAAGRACALAQPFEDHTCYNLAAIVQTIGTAGALRDDDFEVLFRNAMGPRFAALMGALKNLKERARPALGLLVETWLGALRTDPPELAANVMEALLAIDGSPQALACLEALTQHPDIFSINMYLVAPWIKRLDHPERRPQLWALIERMWAGLHSAILQVPLAQTALAVQHPSASLWVIQGLQAAATPDAEADMQPWIGMVQAATLDDPQANAIARVLLRDAQNTPRSWRRAGGVALFAAKTLDPDVRALLMARWSEVYAASLDAQGRLPRAPRKKRLTLEVMTFAVAIHERLQNPARAEIAGRALARWSHIYNQVNLHKSLRYGSFFDTLSALVTALFRELSPASLTPAVFEALSRGLLANTKTLDSLQAADVTNDTRAALKSVLAALNLLYSPTLDALRASHSPLDRLCRLVEGGDDSATSPLAAELARLNLPTILTRCLTP